MKIKFCAGYWTCFNLSWYFFSSKKFNRKRSFKRATRKCRSIQHYSLWSKLCNSKLQRFYTVQQNCGRLWSAPIKGFKWKLEMQSAVKNAHENSLIHFELSCCRIVFKDGVIFILCFSCLAGKCKIWQLMSNILSCSPMLTSFHKAFINITMLKHYNLSTINYWEIVCNFVCTRFIIPIVYLNMLQSK